MEIKSNQQVQFTREPNTFVNSQIYVASMDDKEKQENRMHIEFRFICQRNDEKGNFRGTGASLKSYNSQGTSSTHQEFE